MLIPLWTGGQGVRSTLTPPQARRPVPVCAGVILGSFFIGYVWVQLPGGFVCTKYGGAPFLLVAVGGCGLLSIVAMFVAQNFWLLLAVRVLQGIVQGPVFPSLTALLAHWAPVSERVGLVSSVMLGALLGTMAGLSSSGALCGIQDFCGLKGLPRAFAVTGGCRGLAGCG